MNRIRTIIVDDHPAVRMGLEAILSRFENILVVGVADSGQAALELCRREQVDVALIDVFMPIMDGIQTMRALHAEYPAIRCVMLTYSDRDELITKAIGDGAIGYLLKDADISEIANAIRAAAAGKRSLSEKALEVVIRAREHYVIHPDDQLTDREREVLNLMVKGLKNPQIATAMQITLSTVKFHVSMIFKKLKASTRTEAVVQAIEKGLLESHDHDSPVLNGSTPPSR